MAADTADMGVGWALQGGPQQRGLYPLDTSSFTPSSGTTRNVSGHCQMSPVSEEERKLPLAEKHSVRVFPGESEMG